MQGHFLARHKRLPGTHPFAHCPERPLFDTKSGLGVKMKSLRVTCLAVVSVFVLVLGCNQKTGTPASTTESSSTNSGSTSAKKTVPGTAVTIPAGTVITVRLGEALSSKSSHAGQGFSATVAEPVTVDGKTLIDQGAGAHGTVVAAKAMGHFKGVELPAYSARGSPLTFA